jgi:DNA-binding transcriptional regulator GbsR (MarR family)
MTSKLDEVFKKVLNDRDIFDSLYDKNAKKLIPKLFEGSEWKELGELFKKGKKDDFISKIDTKLKEIEEKEQGDNNWRSDRINELKRRAEWLKSAFDNKPHLLKQLFENLEWYGLVKCKLPNMDSYGKVIERYDLSTVEQYFLDKINRSSDPQKKALEKVLEYVKELYNNGVSPEEIAYFVRKLDSLTKYWEVIE